ncbi:MAG: 4Fe-4S dicluster domain-containing protein [Vicinamibacterales bacterium]|nr:4Fe-4S dicluster domain-containing protein [Vicinamibacterales bacterium]
MRRRELFAWIGRIAKGLVLGMLGLGGARLFRASLVSAEAAPPGQHPLRPPGALDEPKFRAACTRCFLCAEVCPVRCIEFPSRVEGAQPPLHRARGALPRRQIVAPVWQGGDTPYILPWKTGCIVCMKCGPACPTGAIRPIAENRDAIKREVRMGLAEIDRKICLPWTRTSWCGACLTVCPYRDLAITVDHRARPTVHAEHCIGCGLCVEVCPIRHKAIAVKPPFSPDRGEVRAE